MFKILKKTTQTVTAPRTNAGITSTNCEQNKLSQEIYEISNSEFNTGLISYSDWLTIKISTENDNLEMIQSKYDLWETWVQWNQLIGPQGNEVDFE